MRYAVEFEEINLKEAVQEITENRVVYYTYKQQENKTLWQLDKEMIKHVVFTSILNSEEVLFLKAVSGCNAV